MTSNPATLLIPVENQVRELDAKLLLSCAAVERGYPVIMGSRPFIHFKVASVPRGVYLAKSMRYLSDRMFKLLRQLGHEIVAFDEEALVRLRDDEYYRRRLSARALGLVSQLLAWGPDDARVLREFEGNPGIPITITGNPRIDMMRPELRRYFDSEVQGIRKRYGDFILINTNFGEFNHFYANLSAARDLAEGKTLQGESDYMVRHAQFRLEIFRAFQEMVPALSEAFPDLTIVVRPHPSESHDLWRSLTSTHGNLRVINEGSVLPWLLASSGMISNGCTTAVEARVLEVPAANYQPVVDERYDDPLPQAISHRCFDLESLFDFVRGASGGKLGLRDDAECREALERHLFGLEERGLATDRILDVFDKAGYRDAPPPSPGLAKFAVAWLHTHARTLEKRFNMRRPGHRNNWSYHAHRFPEISAEEIQDRVLRLSKLTGRFEGITVEPYSPYLFRVCPAGGV